jgi:hypothetical protein
MENGGALHGDIVLIAIAVYGSAFMLIKTLFAIYNHCLWMCCIKCCKTVNYDEKRMDTINSYWKKEYE